MIWKAKTARILFNYEVLADLNLVTVKTSGVIPVVDQKLKMIITPASYKSKIKQCYIVCERTCINLCN